MAEHQAEQKQYFHFTLGPVQGFVAQARRTRDFWAGSFLLSWLSGVAMVEVQRQGGKVQFPIPPGGYLEWIQGKGRGAQSAPRQGSIPNRFKSMLAQVPADFNGELVAQAVRHAWQALAEHIWVCDQLDGTASQGHGTRAIWERQNANFWDISWALSKNDQETSLLDQRKNWRSHGFEQTEGGVKCMVMDGWQELSGAERPGKQSNAFWAALHRTRIQGIQTDLGEKEQLCALAYIKRRFTRHFASFEVRLAGTGLPLKGWRLSPSVPSVSYMAAVHWLEKLLQVGQDAQVQALLEHAQGVNPERSEWDTDIQCLRQAVPDWYGDDPRRHLLALDGNLFFEHVQQQPQAYGYDPQAMLAWQQALRNFGHQYPSLGSPSPFYALLLMDGDSLGSHMSNPENQTKISNALLNFTNGPGENRHIQDSVPDIVERYNGFLIYAGGDDVLAILPLEDALGCAAAVRQHYLNCFESSGIPTTISAAIEFAHVKTPLGKVLGDAHPLLDDVAKEGAGRDALAVRVWKTSGQVLEWAQPWKVALRDNSQELVVQSLARCFNEETLVKDQQDQSVQFSSKFFYKIAERFKVLNPSKDDRKRILSVEANKSNKKTEIAKSEGENENQILSAKEASELLAVDFLASAENRRYITVEQARDIIEPLLTQCRPHVRQLDKTTGRELPPDTWPQSARLQADGALLVRFLATKGLEEGDRQ